MPTIGQVNVPRQGAFTAVGTIYWSDGITPFDGFMLVGIGYPVDSTSTNWPSLNKGAGSQPRQRVPQWCKIPIVYGLFDQNSKLWYNSDLDPPNTLYYAYFYDYSNKQIAGPTAGFQINSSSTTITVPVLPTPTFNPNPPAPIAYPGD